MKLPHSAVALCALSLSFSLLPADLALAQTAPAPIIINFEGGPWRTFNPVEVLRKARRFTEEQLERIRRSVDVSADAADAEGPVPSPEIPVVRTVHHSVGEKKICAEIHELKRQAPERKVILVGHSFGAERAIKTAHCLDRKKVPIDGLITFDSVNVLDFLPYNPFLVPKNVMLNFHFYQQQDGFHLFRLLTGEAPCALNLRAKGNSTSIIYNFKLSFDNPFRAHRYTFTKMYDSGILHQLVDAIRKSKPHPEIHAEIFTTLATSQRQFGFRTTRTFECRGSADQDIERIYRTIVERRTEPVPATPTGTSD
jgi:hypothetical protein